MSIWSVFIFGNPADFTWKSRWLCEPASRRGCLSRMVFRLFASAPCLRPLGWAPVRERLSELMEAAAAGGAYADVRFVRRGSEFIATRNGEVDELHRDEDEGIGVRVRVGGAWGFAATRETSKAGAEAALARALAIARAQPRAQPTQLAPEPVARGEHRAGEGTNPFDVPLDRKLERLLAADAALGSDRRLNLRQAHYGAYARDTIFASTEGALYDQRVVETGGGLAATAVAGDEVQARSFPGSHRGDTMQAGYEHFDAMPLVDQAPRLAEEAIALLTAPACPSTMATLIVDGEQLALQV